MSALPPKADMCGATRYVRFVPIADMAWEIRVTDDDGEEALQYRFPRHPSPYDLGARDAGFFPIAGKPLLLQVNGLITAVLVELCSPHFVHALVLGSTEGHWCSESKVQVLEIFESLNELFGIEIRPIALQRGD